MRTRWAVGCDGGGSWVRQLLGIEFGGSTFRQRWLVVDVLVDRPLAKVPHPHFFGEWRRPTVSLPMSPGRHRWEWMLHPGEDPEPFLDPEAVRRRIDRWLDSETATVERAVVYTFHARTAARWREGRVALLDTYELERRPHVEAMQRLAVALGGFVQTADRRVAALRDVLLGTLDRTGIAGWAESRVKPLPAYGAGAFAVRPRRLVFRRGVGAQFPQPRVRVGGEDLPLDDALGSGWRAISVDPAAAEALGAEGLAVFVVGRDLEDHQGVIGEWLARFGASWAVLRPDRFVFALGDAGGAEIRRALDSLHRQLGRATPGLIAGRSGAISQASVAA